jgi:hypothetical protein
MYAGLSAVVVFKESAINYVSLAPLGLPGTSVILVIHRPDT